MKNNTSKKLILIGLILVLTGFIILKTEIIGIKLIQYILISLGCGLFGQGASDILSKKAMKNHPDILKQQEIVQKDERNLAIRDKCKSKAYDMMTLSMGILIVSYALMDTNFEILISFVVVYLFIYSFLRYIFEIQI